MSDLFRKQAVQHATQRLVGEVILAIPVKFSVLAMLAGIAIVGGIIFASSATYGRKESVQGWVVPSGGIIRVQARNGGVVTAIHAQPETLVSAGAPLVGLRLAVDTQQGGSEVRMTEGLANETAANNERLSARVDGIQMDRARLLRSQRIAEAELQQMGRRIDLQRAQLALAQREVDRAQSIVDRGFMPQRELDARRSAALAAEEYSGQLESQRLGLQRQLGEIDAQLATLPATERAVRSEAEAAKALLNQRSTDVDAQGGYVAIAPINARLSAITVHQGQTVSAGETVAVIVPQNSKLEVELFVPARSIGFIRPGQRVRLLYDAFPYQKFGAGSGQVISVSSTLLAPTELGSPLVVVREAVYRVKVKISSPYVNAYNARIPIRSGMTLTADVVIDRRSLLEWLLDPLYAAGRRN